MKFKYLCTSWIKLVTSLHYCLSCGSPSETSGLVISSKRQSLDNAHNDEGFFRTFGGLNRQDLTVAIVVMVKKLY